MDQNKRQQRHEAGIDLAWQADVVEITCHPRDDVDDGRGRESAGGFLWVEFHD